ncbi:DNA cytosine methyltransferase [Bacillus sp. FJAT-49711]|uniref:DNA cytosine methyltransferase n=1 Tax=Bacillus sp. FJAT-49711 TaxID=2833585 RepID=UPI0032D5981E
MYSKSEGENTHRPTFSRKTNAKYRQRKKRKENGFHGSFGRTGDPFPTLLAGSVNYFSFWYEGEENDGFIRQLTPLECERLMGLPEGWTALGNKDESISDYARYKAIAVPCAEYIMAGIAEVL